MRLDSYFAAVLLAVFAAGCDRVSQAPRLSPTDADAAPQSVEIASHSGQSFAAFTASPGFERFALEKLDLTPDEQARVTRDMTLAQPSRLIRGGGAQALVFAGCASAGCASGRAVLAIGGHGETFVGVRDSTGAEELISDDRMEALLRLDSPTRRWDDPGVQTPGQDAALP